MIKPTCFQLTLADGVVFTLHLEPDRRSQRYRFKLARPDGSSWTDPTNHLWSYHSAIGSAMAFVGSSLGSYVTRCEPVAKVLRLVK